MLISNHVSFRLLFDKIASVYILFEKYIYILALEMASPGNQHCVNNVSTDFRSLYAPAGMVECREVRKFSTDVGFHSQGGLLQWADLILSPSVSK